MRGDHERADAIFREYEPEVVAARKAAAAKKRAEQIENNRKRAAERAEAEAAKRNRQIERMMREDAEEAEAVRKTYAELLGELTGGTPATADADADFVFVPGVHSPAYVPSFSAVDILVYEEDTAKNQLVAVLTDDATDKLDRALVEMVKMVEASGGLSGSSSAPDGRHGTATGRPLWRQSCGIARTSCQQGVPYGAVLR